MFNFFKKTEIQQVQEENTSKSEDDHAIAAITYLVKSDGVVMVDIAIDDYDEKSMIGLLCVLDKLSQDKCYVETVNIIKESLVKDGQEELAVMLIGHVAKQMTTTETNKFLNTYQETLNSQPCIKPSDMLK